MAMQQGQSGDDTTDKAAAPDLEWLEGDVPRAQSFSDTYFSKAGGLEETRHVFLKGNGLPEGFSNRQTFTIAEFGFGTGLNFLATLASLKTVPVPPALTFLSFELYPMSRDQLERALRAFPELADLAASLVESWAPEPGWNRFEIEGAILMLGVGDARQLIRHLSLEEDTAKAERLRISSIDAWFLDGFSPARNPELWDENLLKSAAELTRSGGTLATYTAAGWVRRNLQSAGFTIEKVAGFAGKREMVVGRKN